MSTTNTIPAMRKKSEQFTARLRTKKAEDDGAIDVEIEAKIERMHQRTLANPEPTERYFREQEALRIAEMRQARENRFAEICPPIYQHTDPVRLPGLAQCKLAMEWRTAWGKDKPGIVLHGASGRGKTRTAWLLIRRILFEQGLTVNGISATAWATQSTDSARRCQTGAWIAEWQNVGALLLDDLDKARFTERVEADLFDLLEHRFSHGKLTIITINSVAGGFRRLLSPQRGPAIIRRMTEFCAAINFNQETKAQ